MPDIRMMIEVVEDQIAEATKKKNAIASLAQGSHVDKSSPRGRVEQRRWESAWLKEEAKILKLQLKLIEYQNMERRQTERDMGYK